MNIFCLWICFNWYLYFTGKCTCKIDAIFLSSSVSAYISRLPSTLRCQRDCSCEQVGNICLNIVAWQWNNICLHCHHQQHHQQHHHHHHHNNHVYIFRSTSGTVCLLTIQTTTARESSWTGSSILHVVSAGSPPWGWSWLQRWWWRGGQKYSGSCQRAEYNDGFY